MGHGHDDDLEPFPEEIEGFLDIPLGGCLVDADVTDVSQQGEVDGVALVFLVVGHQFDEGGIIVAGDG